MPTQPAQLPRQPGPWHWTREQYYAAGEAGCFGDEKVELIGGVVTQEGMADRIPSPKPPYATAVGLTWRLLWGMSLPVAHARVHMPLAISDDSEPEPDVAVVAGAIRDYALRHPTSALLVAEVADTTLAYDRRTKAALYAHAGIPEYWILNLPERCLEVHRGPAPDPEQPFGAGYRSILRLADDDAVAPLASPDHTLLVKDMLP